MLKRLWSDEKGQGMVEYGLILALVAIAAIVILRQLGGSINGIFGEAKNELENAL